MSDSNFDDQLWNIDEGTGRTFGAVRSSKWETVEKHFKDGKLCEACGGKDQLEVHHVVPFHKHPELELETSNLIVLCFKCHFYIGHAKDWKGWNPDVRADAAAFMLKVNISRALAKKSVD